MLTKAQKRALDAIVAHEAEHGKPPTYGELAARLGLASRSTAHDLVMRLIDRGFVRSLGSAPKATIVVVRTKAYPS